LSRARGFTLLEALLVAALIAILAVAAIPVLASRDAARLDSAATEARNLLRFALSEAARSGGYVLVDGSVAGRLSVVRSDAVAVNLGAVSDPLHRRALQLDAGDVALAPRFFQGGTAYQQLLVGPAGQMQVFDGGVNRGPLEPGSGVALSLGSLSTTVEISHATGRVAIAQ
jgi:prepilin-type N-terminal cleavage/methylation domain-containing protein